MLFTVEFLDFVNLLRNVQLFFTINEEGKTQVLPYGHEVISCEVIVEVGLFSLVWSLLGSAEGGFHGENVGNLKFSP